MKRKSFCVLVCIAGMFMSSFASAAGIVPPGEDALRKSAKAFELSPGVVADPTGDAVYLMKPGGGIDKVSTSTGDRIWSTVDADKPLALYGELLIAQRDRADVSGRLEVVLLDAMDGGRRRLTLPLDLPEGVKGSIDDGLRRSVMASASVVDGEPRVSWESTQRYVRPIPPRPGESLQTKNRSDYRLDLAASRAVAVEAPGEPPMPISVREGAAATAGAGQIVRAPKTFVAIDVEERRDITFKRWDAASGQALPDLSVFSRTHDVRVPSADGRHLLVSERAHPGEFAEYEWSILSLETGELVGQVRHHQSSASFFVADETVVCIERPYGHRVAGAWTDEPRKLTAIRLDETSVVWDRPLRDTTYRGEYPR